MKNITLPQIAIAVLAAGLLWQTANFIVSQSEYERIAQEEHEHAKDNWKRMKEIAPEEFIFDRVAGE